MRYIGDIPHPIIKISIFKMDNKYSLKLEMGMYEQTYKWRDIDYLDTPDKIEKIVDDDFLQTCLSHFKIMHETFAATLKRNL